MFQKIETALSIVRTFNRLQVKIRAPADANEQILFIKRMKAFLFGPKVDELFQIERDIYQFSHTIAYREIIRFGSESKNSKFEDKLEKIRATAGVIRIYQEDFRTM